MFKQIVPRIANSASFDRFVRMLEQADPERANLFRVLTYHRVDRPDSYSWMNPGLISASPEAFEGQMKYMAANYQPVSTSDVIAAFDGNGRNTLPPRAVMVTFDDGYCDFEKYAWPVLKQYRIPATVFIPTAYPDHPERLFWWDRLFHAVFTTSARKLDTPIGRLDISTREQRERAYRDLKSYLKTQPHEKAMTAVDEICNEHGPLSQANPVLDWPGLRKLASEGVELGAHTRNHPIMSHLTPEEIQKEVLDSLEDLTREIGSRPLTFAYPSGMYNKEVVQAVARAGFKLAFTTERGINDVNQADRFRLYRINVGTRTTLPILRAQLLSWSAPFYSLNSKHLS